MILHTIVISTDTTVQLKFNFTHARKDTRAFTSFLRGITEYFSSN